MTLHLAVTATARPFRMPFRISRQLITQSDAIEVTLTDADGHVGRGEALGIPYAGETPDSMIAAIAAFTAAIEAGIDREALLWLLPAGGARCAVDAALWDLAAKAGGIDPFAANGLAPAPVSTALTIGIQSLAGYEAEARSLANCPWIKIKTDGTAPLDAIAAVRRGAPRSRFIVDPNQAWSVAELKAIAPLLPALGVGLLEQPIPVGAEAELDGWTSPVPLCADELVNDLADLDKVRGRFDAVNIKLDKTGGLTAALRLADSAEAMGLQLMVGCMGGTSLAMAPGMVLAQRARWADLDGPYYLLADVVPGLAYRDGVVRQPHVPALWG